MAPDPTFLGSVEGNDFKISIILKYSRHSMWAQKAHTINFFNHDLLQCRNHLTITENKYLTNEALYQTDGW